MPVGKPTVVPNTSAPAALDAVTRVQIVTEAGTDVIEPGGGTISAAVDTAAQSASVGTSSTTIMDANTSRREATVCNDHATNIVYLVLGGTAEANKGVRLNAAGGSYTSPLGYTGAISVIASGAATNVTWIEV
jgi:hypothetical protein